MNGGVNAPRAERRIAVVGAGPAGRYALQGLLELPAVDGVDVFELPPAPYGLVRYGVAADHAKTKSVIKVFHRLLGDERGHRDATEPALLASTKSAVVIGAGNVALDVARILAKHADELIATHMPGAVVDALQATTITNIHLPAGVTPELLNTRSYPRTVDNS